MTSSRHFKSHVLLFLSMVIVGGWCLLLLRMAPHPDLLHRAAPTGFSGATPYQWLSGHELLVFDRAQNHGWNIWRLDTSTGKKISLSGLQHSLPPASDAPYFLKVSPDGKYVVYDGNGSPEIFSIDGISAQQVKWQPELAKNFSSHLSCWLAKGRLVFLPDFISVETIRTEKFLRLPYVDTQRSAEQKAEEGKQERSIHPPQSATASSTFLLHSSSLTIPFLPEFGAEEYYSVPTLTASGLLYACASAYEESETRTLLTLPLTPNAVAAKHVIHAPSGLTFLRWNTAPGEPMHISPQGSRVFWLCYSRPYTPPIPALLHRFIPVVNVPLCRWMSLQVSDLDGSNMREIGGVTIEKIQERQAQSSSEVWLDDADKIQNVRWLPDGQHLSFEYHSTLYTVGVGL